MARKDDNLNNHQLPDGLPDVPSAQEIDVLDSAPEKVRKRYSERRYTSYVTLVLAALVIALMVAGLKGWVDRDAALNVAFGATLVLLAAPVVLHFVRPGPDFKAVDRLLDEECDPYRYARANYNLLVTFKNVHDQYISMVDIANGLFPQGDINGMEAYLARVDTSVVTPMTLYWYHTLRMRSSIYLDNEMLFRKQQADFGAACRSRSNRALKESADAFRDVERFYWAYRRSDEANARRALLERTKLLAEQGLFTRFAQVECRYWQAMLEERIEDWEGMRESCRFVIDNGNLLVYVNAAYDMLAKHAGVLAGGSTATPEAAAPVLPNADDAVT